ncbi:MAG: glutaredoxin domain-containing protein [Candidatus Woesebacteria bacterium]|jgi:glutaredoxin
MLKIKTILVSSVVALFAFLFLLVPQGVNAAEDTTSGVNIYLFWGQGCPHCAKAKPFLEELDKNSDKIHLYTYEVYYNSQNQKLFQEVGRMFNASSGVPLIVIGDRTFVGYSELSADDIKARAEACAESVTCSDSVASVVGAPSVSNSNPSTVGQVDQQDSVADYSNSVNLPIFGEISVSDFSLPLLTVVIAALDGFNPCAMWVLLFLISVLLGMNNRKRMWALGGSFIVASAFVYFMFLTAWLNIFMFIGVVSWVKVLIGIVAVAAGGYYLYDFCYNKAGSCKVAGGGRREKIFAKIRHIAHEKSFWLAAVGIVSLAFAVNLIELVCSAGLPAVYTSILSGANLPTWQYYGYIFLYMLIFMADDLFVFFVAMFTLQVTGVQTKYARFAHLIGGILMLILGVLLIFAPQLLMFG